MTASRRRSSSSCSRWPASQLGIVDETVTFEFGTALRELGGGRSRRNGPRLGGAMLLSAATRRGWIVTGGGRLATLAVAIAAFATACCRSTRTDSSLRSSLASLSRRRVDDDVVDLREAVQLPELGGELLALVVWFIFGAALVPVAIHNLDGAVIAVCAREPDDHPHAPGRAEPDRIGARPAERRVHRLVRAERPRVGRVRLAGNRGARRDLAAGRDRGSPQ